MKLILMHLRILLVAMMALTTLLVPFSLAPKVQAADSVTCTAPATICWDNNSGGNWETATNWILPGGAPAGRIPTASDDVILRLPTLPPGSSTSSPLAPVLGFYNVTINSVQTVHSIFVSFGVTLQCNSACTLTIKSHTPITITVDAIGGGLIGVSGLTPTFLPSADILGVLHITGNLVNDAALVDASLTSIHIDAGGTFVNFNSLSFPVLHNDGVFVEKCGAVVVGGIASVPGTVVTESPCPTQVPTAPGSSVSGIASFSSDLGAFTSLTSMAVSGVSPAPPAGLTFPAGLFSFTISGLRAGGTVTVTITLPSPLPPGAFSYWKLHGGTWTQLPATKVSLDATRSVITLTLVDGANPDDSDLLANGVLVDPGAPAITPPVIPEYPMGLPILAIFMIITYGLIKRRTSEPRDF